MAVRPYKKRSREEVPGVWIIDFYPEGRKGPQVKRKFPESGTRTYAEALEFEQTCRRINHSEAVRPNNPRICDVLPEYLEWHKLHRADRTHKDTLYSLKWLLPIFGNLPVSRITHAEITNFQMTRGCGPRSINKELHYLSAIMTWMHKRGYCDKPIKIEMLPYRRPIPQPPSPGDSKAFLAQIKEPLKFALVSMMYQLGLRFSEAANLRWEAVDQKRVVVTGKGNKVRILPMPDNVWEIIGPSRQEKGYVFPNPKTGMPYGSLKTLFTAASRRAGIKRLTPHSLRHALATDLLAETGDLELVRRVLGHGSITTTQIYTQVGTERIDEALQRTHKNRAQKE